MNPGEVRQKFLDFFQQKGHQIVPSAPLVIKNDPTLMFTNAGMNQFKDYFLGNEVPTHRRVADTQKCLRVSGKHNDLEEVGIDTYHHTLFEMLGNWSFGDYFKEEAIAWAWELLTEVYGLPKDRLYATVFAGDAKEGLLPDEEAAQLWERLIGKDKILYCSKKDNFWEMGETGPCGPCSELHIDLRSEAERAEVNGYDLVNKDHPQVIEIWNLVFIQFNRKTDGSLEPLPEKHVDTGMGFERLCRAIEAKNSNYDTEVFAPLIKKVSELSNITYGQSETSDIAMRVVADHVRAVSFAIADGLLPSNSEAGYVIRRILRRAVRYYYQYLNLEVPVLYRLLDVLTLQFEKIFPELKNQKDFIQKVLYEEEASFLRKVNSGLVALHYYLLDEYKEELVAFFRSNGLSAKQLGHYIDLIDQSFAIKILPFNQFLAKFEDTPLERNIETPLSDRISEARILYTNEVNGFDFSLYPKLKGLKLDLVFNSKLEISGDFAFKMHDAHGFPFDLTNLIAKDLGLTVDHLSFDLKLREQKERSRAAASVDKTDWQVIRKSEKTEFLGYDFNQAEVFISRCRITTSNKDKIYEVVLDRTPFYAESGGQVGDTGWLESANERIKVLNTVKENDLIVHHVSALPENPEAQFTASIDRQRRDKIRSNHSATHLLHAALRQVLGTHVVQKGSLVHEQGLRFDFAHFSRMTEEELAQVEDIVNAKIRENIKLDERREVPMEEAKNMGAMALFGEKYGNLVRVISFDQAFSVELCGGTHVAQTGTIGAFKIVSESAVAAGVRRIEALTAADVMHYLRTQEQEIKQIKELLKNPADLQKSLRNLWDENQQLKKAAEQQKLEKLQDVRKTLKEKIVDRKGISTLITSVPGLDADSLKHLVFDLRQQQDNMVMVLASEYEGKALLSVMLSDNLVRDRQANAVTLIKELGKFIQGGGGGQPFFATAGGKNPVGIPDALKKAVELTEAL